MERKRSIYVSLRRRVFVALFGLVAPCASMAQQPLSDIAGAAPGTVFRDCAECPQMIIVPPGIFTMGSPLSEHGRDPDEEPQRRVTISRAFAVGRSEITRGEFSAFVFSSVYSSEGGGNCWYWNEQQGRSMNDDPRRNWRDVGFAQESDHPVACLSWRDAKAYTAWLSSRTGKSYRLLTETEWEYAARAGSMTPRFWGADPNDACHYANVGDLAFKGRILALQGDPQLSVAAYHRCDDGYAFTAPVGRFRANGFGLHDMMGNVAEWVEDCWNESYDNAPSDGRAWLTGDCRRRVVRGGGWSDIPGFVRSANRDGKAPGLRMLNLGFRVARSD